MRPIPKARHAVAVAVFLAVAVLVHFQAAVERDMTDDQVGVAVNVVRSLDDQLYGRDPVYGRSQLWRFQTPVWQWYLREAYLATGQTDLRRPLAMLAGPLVFIYLVGMYLLLWRQCRSWSVACYVAVMSTAVITVAGGGQWGLGPLSTMTAETVYLAATPLMVWAFVLRIGSKSALWVFAAAGALANVHLVTGMNLSLVLAVMVAANRRFSWRGWLMAFSGLLCSAAAAGPTVWYCFAQRWAFAPTFTAGWSAVEPALRRGELTVLLPDMLTKALELPSLAYSLALWIPALAVIFSGKRLHVRGIGPWVWFLVAALGVGLVLHGASQLVGALTGSAPPVIDFVHAIRFTMLALYVLFSQAVVNVMRLGVARRAVRMTLAALIAIWLVPAENLSVPRHWVQDALTSPMPEEELPENVEKRLVHSRRNGELLSIGRFLQAYTPVDTVVICEEAGLRLWSRRALVVCRADVKHFYYLAPDRLQDWADLLREQFKILHPPAGGPVDREAMDQFAQRHGAEYVVMGAWQMDPPQDQRQWVRPPAEEKDGWGRYWRLYRSIWSASQPATTAPGKPD
ncbi:MAG: hypothetical protein HQ546_07425 [Planctomycetes bacterium]|nr:hypothetical protein [Planctomycetota bacterium]